MLPSNTTSRGLVISGNSWFSHSHSHNYGLVDGREVAKLLEVSNFSITGSLTVLDAEL